MCSNCSIYRDSTGGDIHTASSVHEESHGPLHGLISRRRLLETTGAGVLTALTSGMLMGQGAFATTEDKAPYLCLIVLDGARPEYLNVPNIPHVKSLVKSGTQFSNMFAGIMEAETPAAHTAIGTGSVPARNGILGFNWTNTKGNQISIFSGEKVRAGAMADIVKAAGVPTISSSIHKAYQGSKVVALSGSKYYAADVIGGPDADVIMYFYGTDNGKFIPTAIPNHYPPIGLLENKNLQVPNKNMPLGQENHLAMQLAVNTFNRMRQRVTLINMPEFDWPLGHVDGSINAQSSVQTLMHHFDQDFAMLQQAYHKAGVLDRTIFVLLGDHGMMPLEHKIDASVLTGAIRVSRYHPPDHGVQHGRLFLAHRSIPCAGSGAESRGAQAPVYPVCLRQDSHKIGLRL